MLPSMLGTGGLKAALGAGLVATVLVAPAAASAAETTVGFDPPLSPGEVVKSQYEAQGIRFGTRTELGLGGSGLTCGAPIVEKGFEPPSSPDFAELQPCPSAGPPFTGTYAKLLASPSGSVSVYVRNLAVGSGGVAMRLVLYDSAGTEVATGKGEATTTGWTRITADPGAAHVSFVGVVTETGNPTPAKIGIDDLSFQREETSAPPGGPEPPKPPSPPSAVVSLLTPPHAGAPLTLSGSGSSAGSGHVISYEWDFNGDGKTDTSTGTNPISRVILPPGVHTIALRITNSNGESSSTKLGVTIPKGVVISLPQPDGGEGECQTSFEIGDAKLLGECVQKAGAGWVIETRQLDLNGMVLSTKGGGFGVFHIASTRRYGLGTEYVLSGPKVNVELLNTPIGDMVLGGRDLEAEPIQIALLVEKRPIVKLASAPRAHAADEAKEIKAKGQVLMSLGVGKPCSGNPKEVNCCPPSGPTKACATLPGGFPLTGQVVVYLNSKGQVLFDVQVKLALEAVSFQATGELEIVAGLETGIELGSLKFGIPEASLMSIFKVKDASFAYYFPGDPDPNKRDTWQAKATITFGLLEEPGLEGELSFQHGQFHSASLVLTLPPPGVPVYPGIDLNKMGGSVGVEPISFGGTLGASIASTLELELSFKYAEETTEQLGFFGGKGVLKLKDEEIATLEGDVYSDGYTDALLQVKFGVPFNSKEPTVSVEGEIGFWDEPNSGLWEAGGRVHAKIWILEGELAGLVNNKYVAGCAALGPFGAVGYWDFETSSLGGEGFVGSCKDHLKTYKQVPLVKHVGGFVNETETESLRAHAGAATGREQATIALAPSPLGQDLKIESSSGIPVVKLIGPGGQTFTTPAKPGQVVMSGSQFVAALGGDPHHVIVYLASTAGGAWQVKRAAGSAPITSVEVAEVAPAPAFTVHVRHGRGGSWTLAYRIAHFTPGTKVRLYERGRDSSQLLATVAKAQGTLRFTPKDALGRARHVYATLLGAEGVPLQTVTVAAYTAPRGQRPGRVRRLKILRRIGSALVTWAPASGARRYRILVKGSDGRIESFFTSARRRSVTIPRVLPIESFTATVIALGGPNMVSGPRATARLKAANRTLRPRAKHGAKGRKH